MQQCDASNGLGLACFLVLTVVATPTLGEVAREQKAVGSIANFASRAGLFHESNRPVCLRWIGGIEESRRTSLEACSGTKTANFSSSPTSEVAAYAASAVLYFTGKQKEALRYTEQFLPKFKTSASYLHFTARLVMTIAGEYGERHRLKLARQYITAALKYEPNNPNVLATQARLVEEHDKFHAALLAYEKIVRLDPNHAYSYVRLSRIHHVLDQHQNVLDELDNAVKAEPDYVLARRYRGNLRLAQGEAAGALNDFDVVLKASPNDTLTRTYRISALLQLGQDDAASAEIADLLVTENGQHRFALAGRQRAKLHLTQARLLQNKGRLGDAADHAMQAIQTADKRTTLRLQVFLRRSTYENLAINGKVSDEMKRALRSCFEQTNCWSEVTRRL